jgi:hypothetical protein
MDAVNSSIAPPAPKATLSVDLMGFGEDAADGGFILYPNMSNRGYLTKRTVCPATLLEPLVLAACSRNVDFKFANKFLENLLNINNMFSIIKFILANEVNMLPGNG